MQKKLLSCKRIADPTFLHYDEWMEVGRASFNEFQVAPVVFASQFYTIDIPNKFTHY